MLQKYFPVLSEINSPLSALVALNFNSEAAKIAVEGISNETLHGLLLEAVSSTAAFKKEVEISISEIETARKKASKTTKTLRYRATCVARKARAISKLARRIKASKRLAVSKPSLKGLSGLSLDICRQRAANAQAAVKAAAACYNTALEAVETVIEKGGDCRSIKSAVAALKVAVRELEVRHLEFKFAREMLSISLARHSA